MNYREIISLSGKNEFQDDVIKIFIENLIKQYTLKTIIEIIIFETTKSEKEKEIEKEIYNINNELLKIISLICNKYETK